MKKIPMVAIFGNLFFMFFNVSLVLAMIINRSCPECYVAGVIKGSIYGVELNVVLTLAVLAFTAMTVGFNHFDSSTEVGDKVAVWGAYFFISQIIWLYIPALVHFTVRVLTLIMS